MADLVIHVINGGVGESIIVQLPTGGWGVVDCYTPSLTDPASNPTLQFLKQNGVTDLEFFCLTHPHDDHYRGMNQLLDEMKVKYFWRFGAFTPYDLKQILLGYFLATAKEGGEDEELENAHELTRALAKAYQKKADGEISKIFLLNDVKPLYPLPLRSNPDFEITSIAPSTDKTQRYEKDLRKCFDKDGKLAETMPHQRHNDVSAALVIRYGKAKVILCGDVEAGNWEDTMTVLPTADLSVHGVKVSHHGSTTGYTPELWAHFSADRKPHAVVTPFRRFNLPKKEALQHIRAQTSVLLTTCRSATLGGTSEDFDFWQPYKSTTRMVIESHFRAMKAYRPPAKTGICSLSFDKDGNCSYNCSGDACEVD